MRVLVIGTGDGCEPQLLVNVLKFAHSQHNITELVHLDDSFASTLSARWAINNQVTVIPSYPDWENDFKWTAALNRDVELFCSEDKRPDLIIAFPGGKYTNQLIKMANHFTVGPIVDLEDNFLDLKAKPIQLRSQNA